MDSLIEQMKNFGALFLVLGVLGIVAVIGVAVVKWAFLMVF